MANGDCACDVFIELDSESKGMGFGVSLGAEGANGELSLEGRTGRGGSVGETKSVPFVLWMRSN